MKRYLITGAGTGLGRELAGVYGEAGDKIALVGRRKEKLEEVADELQKQGIEVILIVCDISDYEEVEKLGNAIERELGEIDYLINNAGVGYFGEIENTTVEEINGMIDINVKGTIFVTKRLLSLTKERVLNIISTAGLRGKSKEAVYCASKFALRGFTEALQREFEGSDLKFTGVYMGGMDTPFWDESTHIKDKSRLKSPYEVAKEIRNNDDGRDEIIISKDKK